MKTSSKMFDGYVLHSSSCMAISHSFQMIKVQHEHEEQWWEGRKALIERQKARKEGQKKLEDVL
jgi:hypothetical protein